MVGNCGVNQQPTDIRPGLRCLLGSVQPVFTACTLHLSCRLWLILAYKSMRKLQKWDKWRVEANKSILFATRYFLCWRFLKRMEHYWSLPTSDSSAWRHSKPYWGTIRWRHTETFFSSLCYRILSTFGITKPCWYICFFMDHQFMLVYSKTIPVLPIRTCDVFC